MINYILGAQLDGPMVLLSLAAGGAMDRFPQLQVVTVETGASWLGWIMTQADRIYEDHSMYARPKLSLKPSELMQRQAHATFMFDPVAINNRGVTGISTLMWGNDYPHPEGTWPESRSACEEQFAGVSDKDVQRDRQRQCGGGVRFRLGCARRPDRCPVAQSDDFDAGDARVGPVAKCSRPNVRWGCERRCVAEPGLKRT